MEPSGPRGRNRTFLLTRIGLILHPPPLQPPCSPKLGARAEEVQEPRGRGVAGWGGCGPRGALRSQNLGPGPKWGAAPRQAPNCRPSRPASPAALPRVFCSTVARKLRDPTLRTGQVGQHLRGVHGLGLRHPDRFLQAEQLHSRQERER